MCLTYSVLSSKLATSLSNFLIFINQVKMISHCDGSVIFQDTAHQLREGEVV